ncbi:dockerin type I repeat-containing protein [Ruminococcus sp.]|uniref:dockerin type I repeat-containing protein n=1 Tax=Ruminococcus sp. TaxID=41978 RepID=UPI0025E8D1A3|nr:dockerin type I repeat-containing protein [Ruminococcus sp.]MBQ8965861.1 dockerin type I repeat-containing protein [Ruminococcus sp.]
MKKLTAMFAALCLSAGMACISASALNGDVNRDDDINVTDLTLIAAHVKGIRPLEGTAFSIGDVNGDFNITVTDLMAAAAHVKGLKNLEDNTCTLGLTENEQLSEYLTSPYGLHEFEGTLYSFDRDMTDEMLLVAGTKTMFDVNDDGIYKEGYRAYSLENVNDRLSFYLGVRYTAREINEWFSSDYSGQLKGSFVDESTGYFYLLKTKIDLSEKYREPDGDKLVLVDYAREIDGKIYADVVGFSMTDKAFVAAPGELYGRCWNDYYYMSVQEVLENEGENCIPYGTGTVLFIKNRSGNVVANYIPRDIEFKPTEK